MPLRNFISNLRKRVKFQRERQVRREEQRVLGRPMNGLNQKGSSRPSFQDVKRGLDAVMEREDSHPGAPHLSEQARMDAALAAIEVYVFIGPSGTGKSSRAIEIAAEHQIDYIIDDGLLIHGSRIVAGSTAKRADTQLQAVRVAIFLDEAQVSTMRRTLADKAPDKLLILGTSDAMITRICTQLKLPEPSHIIRIGDVATPDEQRAARERRMRSGHHTIPVPGMEIKHEFSGRITEPLGRWFRRREFEDAQLLEYSDRTVVRPSFSTLGRYSISEAAIVSLIHFIVAEVPGVAGISDVQILAYQSGVLVDVALILEYGYNARDTLVTAQDKLAERVEQLSGMNVLAVNTKAQRLAVPGLSV